MKQPAGRTKIGKDGRRWSFTPSRGPLAGIRLLAYIDASGKSRIYTPDGRVGGGKSSKEK